MVLREPQRNPISIAVVGSGLAGLTAAYLLTSREYGLQIKVHLFEKGPTLGMDSHSMSIAPGSSDERRIDVPMRSFQGGYYKQLIALYRHLGVKFRPADFSYSFAYLSRTNKTSFDLRTYFIYNGSSGIKGVSVPSNGQPPWSLPRCLISYIIFALSTLYLCFNYIRLLVLSAPLLRPDPSVTFRDWATRTAPTGLLARWTHLDASWRHFIKNVLIPLLSAVCTAPKNDVYEHPVSEILEYIWATFGTSHYVVRHGVRDVVSRLSRGIHHIHLSSPIVSVELDPSDKRTIAIKTTTKTYTGFSHLIFATQANSVIPLLSSYHSSLPEDLSRHRQAIAELMQCLQTFQYRKTIVITHSDSSLLPPDERDRRDLNLVVQSQQFPKKNQAYEAEGTLSVPSSYTMATHILKHSGTESPLYQTTNPIIAPCQDSILSVAVLERAIVTVESKSALRGLSLSREGWWPYSSPSSSLGHLQGAGRIQSSMEPGVWFCGSYAHSGIPLLEGCVASARNVVEQGILRSEGVVVHDAPW